jgi:hypothetical protein
VDKLSVSVRVGLYVRVCTRVLLCVGYVLVRVRPFLRVQLVRNEVQFGEDYLSSMRMEGGQWGGGISEGEVRYEGLGVKYREGKE